MSLNPVRDPSRSVCTGTKRTRTEHVRCNCFRDILQSGGSAVDGAIAALLCTSVINPQSMGLGGGAIFTVMNSAGEGPRSGSGRVSPRWR